MTTENKAQIRADEIKARRSAEVQPQRSEPSFYAVVSTPCPHCGEPNEIDFDAADLSDSPISVLFGCDDCEEGIEMELAVDVREVLAVRSLPGFDHNPTPTEGGDRG